MTLAQIIEKVRTNQGSEDDWLYLMEDGEELRLDSEAELDSSGTFDEADDLREILPEGFEERGLHSTIDYVTLQNCIEWADRLAGGPDPAAACDVIRYYLRFDAFPDRLGAPTPPPREETQARLDREFYNILGEERSGIKCRREGCSRGAILHSVLCRPHHFESIKGRPSPFTD